jgi:hypothetical protein
MIASMSKVLSLKIGFITQTINEGNSCDVTNNTNKGAKIIARM